MPENVDEWIMMLILGPPLFLLFTFPLWFVAAFLWMLILVFSQKDDNTGKADGIGWGCAIILEIIIAFWLV